MFTLGYAMDGPMVQSQTCKSGTHVIAVLDACRPQLWELIALSIFIKMGRPSGVLKGMT